MSLVYWDTMLFIYWLEANPEFGNQVDRIYRRMSARGDQLCTSVFTLGEILTGAYKTGHQQQAQQLRKYFDSDALTLLPFTAETADRYARLRADQKVSPPDAIHLATAATADVDLYFTNDRALKKFSISGIKFIVGLDGNVL